GPRHSRTIRATRQWAQNVASAGNSGQALEILSVQIKNAPFGVSDEIGPDEIECLELIHDRAMLQRSVGDIDGAANSWKIIMKVCESDDLDVHVNELIHRAFDGIQSLRKPSR